MTDTRIIPFDLSGPTRVLHEDLERVERALQHRVVMLRRVLADLESRGDAPC
jgi:hypothetical protein